MRRIATASLLIALAALLGCSAPSTSSAPTTPSAVQEVTTSTSVVPRSKIVSASTTPEDVVRTYLDASNRGDGAVMNSLLGKDGSTLTGDLSSSPSIGNITIHPAVGKDLATAAEVSAEVDVLDADNYFSLDPGQAVINFVLLRDDVGLWYVSAISGTQR